MADWIHAVNQAGSSPSMQRLRLRIELRKARQAAGLTQREVARRMEWSPSKLLRIEAGEVGVSVNDLRSLMQLYLIDDASTVESLLNFARGSRKMPFSEYRDIFGKWFLEFLSMESSASMMRSFQPWVIPGVLQTEAYAAGVINSSSSDRFTEEQMSRMIEARMRRKGVLDNPQASFHFILDESVIRRSVGGSAVMRSQLHHLADVAESLRHRVMVLPFSCGFDPAATTAFSLLEFANDMPPFLYFEKTDGQASTSTNESEYVNYLEVFWSLESKSLKGARLVNALRLLAEQGGGNSLENLTSPMRNI
ncbi:helix-turn-helix domain-containing protein [Streptomyces sp. NPDC060085]|uniref:helix-turn-helix domain-containing protein n=1 Tax=Streptomyces sp. NPDC060085 TaxID=3347054 RepID=UPI003666BFF8